MADVLTHVLVGYLLGTLLALRYDWLDERFVTVVMLGALLPDLTKVSLVVDDALVEGALGVPFSWFAIHTPAGSLVACAVGALLVGDGYRRRVFALLAIGAVSHHVLDALLLSVTGHSYALAWPLSTYHFPSPNLYLSSDRWPALVAGALAAGTWAYRRRESARLNSDEETQ